MNHAINKYQLRLDVQAFLWPVYQLIYLHRSFKLHLRFTEHLLNSHHFSGFSVYDGSLLLT